MRHIASPRVCCNPAVIIVGRAETLQDRSVSLACELLGLPIEQMQDVLEHKTLEDGHLLGCFRYLVRCLDLGVSCQNIM